MSVIDCFTWKPFLVLDAWACAYSVSQSCLTLCNPMDSPPGSSVQEILQARILEWVAISFSRGSSQPRDWTHVSCVSCIGRWILYHWATWEALFLVLVVFLDSKNLELFLYGYKTYFFNLQNYFNCLFNIKIYKPKF